MLKRYSDSPLNRNSSDLRLEKEFIRLPLQFDAAKLRDEYMALPNAAWRPHPQGFAGNTAVPLIAKYGNVLDDAPFGPMAATPWLAQMPYLRALLGRLGAPLGRSRLMRIDRESQVPAHTDLDYYWQSRLRIHVPIRTQPSVQFECGQARVHMAAGQTWVFDTTRLHRVVNPEHSERVHLVVDSIGSGQLLALLQRGIRSDEPWPLTELDCPGPALRFERYNRPQLIAAAELRELLRELCAMIEEDLGCAPSVALHRALWPIIDDWAAAWAEHGCDPDQPIFTELRGRIRRAAGDVSKGVVLRGTALIDWVNRWLIEPAISSPRVAAGDADVESPAAASSTIVDLTPIAVVDESAEKRFASEYTDSLPRLIEYLGGSLSLTTYASDRVVLLRAKDGELNTHFKQYQAPMGLAFDGNRAALGAARSVWLFRRQDDLGQALEPNADRVYAPVCSHITGDIRVHELAWGREGLWVVNTRFSCLANLDDQHSFLPRWHPRFISRLSAEDACHLNGLAMVDGRPGWTSALGVATEAGGWREKKLNGGVLIDVDSGEIAVSGLCMPHSPRWHAGALWVLDSGRGELCRVDLNRGRWDTVVRLPGFARGLAMVERYAFVGCSRVRESAWFGGLPILDRDNEPECGVWAVDLSSGEIVGWLRFEPGIDEIFDIQWLDGVRWPDLLESDEDTALNGFFLPAELGDRFR